MQGLCSIVMGVKLEAVVENEFHSRLYRILDLSQFFEAFSFAEIVCVARVYSNAVHILSVRVKAEHKHLT